MKRFYNVAKLVVFLFLIIQVLSQQALMADPLRECTGSITLQTQAEVDAFPSNGCTVIEGDLTITGSNITNLQGLISLTQITGTLTISSTGLSNLQGLNNLDSVNYSIRIESNALLLNVNGFESLDFTGRFGLYIASNALLSSISSFQSLNIINDNLTINHNPSLLNLDGLDSVTEITASSGSYLHIIGNTSLQNIDGLGALTYVRQFNAASASVTIRDNPALLNVDGLRSLQGISARFSAFLDITNNDALTNLNGLSSLTTIFALNNSLSISGNASLTQIDGLSQLRGGDARCSIIVINNPLLFRCCGLYKAITGLSPDDFTNISGNGAGCTVEDIRAGGPCQECIAGNVPQERQVFAEFSEGYAPHATNIIVNHYEPGILYELRKESNNSSVAGPQSGAVGLYVQGVTETTTYYVLARKPETGCEIILSDRPVITILTFDSSACEIPLDKNLVAESSNGSPGMATNIIVINGENGVEYLLRREADDTPVAGP